MPPKMKLYIDRKKHATYLPLAKVRVTKRVWSSEAITRRILKLIQDNCCAGLVIHGVYRPCRRKGPNSCDHIVELQYHGVDSIRNLQMLCKWCHRKKTGLNKSKQQCL